MIRITHQFIATRSPKLEAVYKAKPILDVNFFTFFVDVRANNYILLKLGDFSSLFGIHFVSLPFAEILNK